jgi:hypothetical protein
MGTLQDKKMESIFSLLISRFAAVLVWTRPVHSSLANSKPLIASHIETTLTLPNAFLHVFHAPSTPHQTF